jgi:hypothetical protein
LAAVGSAPPPDPNPLVDPRGRHRLQVVSPDDWWPEVVATPADQCAVAIRQVAVAVAGAHDARWPHPVRAAAVGQIGRGPSPELVAALTTERAFSWAAIAAARPPLTPEPLVPGWNGDLVAAEQQARGWECLAMALDEPTPERLADVVYAALGAGLTR